MVKNKFVELSLHEQMYIHTQDYTKLFVRFALIIGCILALSLFIFQDMNSNNLLFDPPTNALSYIIMMIIISGSILVWFIITGKKKITDLSKIVKKYTNDAYFLALGLTSHKNDENITNDFYEMCLSVFPELKQADNKSLKETGEILELEELTLELEDKEYSLTVVSISNQKFIIKYFEKTNVNYDQLKEYVKIVNKEFSGDIFRVVCLAKEFDSLILKKYETLSQNIPLDLIIVTDNGFSGLRISESKIDQLQMKY